MQRGPDHQANGTRKKGGNQFDDLHFLVEWFWPLSDARRGIIIKFSGSSSKIQYYFYLHIQFTYIVINPFRTKTSKYLFPRENKPLLYHQIVNINFFIFITNQYNLMFCVDKIKYEKFGNPFQSKKLPICT